MFFSLSRLRFIQPPGIIKSSNSVIKNPITDHKSNPMLAGDTVSQVAILSKSHRQFQILSLNPGLKYYYIPILNMSFILSNPDQNLFYPIPAP